jgi:hypothetical protein
VAADGVEPPEVARRLRTSGWSHRIRGLRLASQPRISIQGASTIVAPPDTTRSGYSSGLNCSSEGIGHGGGEPSWCPLHGAPGDPPGWEPSRSWKRHAISRFPLSAMSWACSWVIAGPAPACAVLSASRMAGSVTGPRPWSRGSSGHYRVWLGSFLLSLAACRLLIRSCSGLVPPPIARPVTRRSSM